jgi:hypothetical protein
MSLATGTAGASHTPRSFLRYQNPPSQGEKSIPSPFQFPIKTWRKFNHYYSANVIVYIAIFVIIIPLSLSRPSEKSHPLRFHFVFSPIYG